VPDFGITKTIAKAARGAKGAARPGLEDAAVMARQIEPPPLTPKPVEVPPPKMPDLQPPKLDTPVIDAEARRLSTLKLGEYDLDAVHQTNFDMITTTDDVKAVIADTAERNKVQIQEARRGKITNEQLAGLAADLNIETDVVRAVLERESGGVLKPETILAARQVLNASADRVLTLGKKIASGQASDIERLQFRRQIQFHDEYQRGFMGARAETGRALNAFGIPTGLDANPAQLKKLNQVVETMYGHDTEKLAEMVSQLDTVEGLNKFTREYSRSRLMGTVQELFINSILSGPKTHLVNTIGNALFTTMNTAELAVAARLGRFLPGTEHVQVGEATATLFGQITAFRDAMRYAGRAFKEGGSLNRSAKFESQFPKAISARNYFPNGVPHPSLGAAIDAIGALIRLPTERVMAPTDEFFKTLAYRGEVARQAYLHGLDAAAAQSLPDSEVAARIAAFMDNPPAEATVSAENWAEYVTFQSPLGETGRKFQSAIGSEGAQKFGAFLVAPFIRTPVNVFLSGLAERSPLAVFSARFREALKNGGRERDLAIARVSMGTLTVASVAAAAASGCVTGGGPQNPQARKILESSGWQPYSICWKDDDGTTRYQSYSRAEPLAFVIGATADAVELLTYLDYDDELKTEQEQANNAIAAIVAGVANNTMSKTFLQGVADFSEMLNDPKRYAQSWLESTGSALIPYSSFRRQMGQMADPTIRQADDFMSRLRNQSGIPGLSESSPPVRNIYGDPVFYKGGSLMGAMSPFPDTQAKPDRVTDTLVALMNETRTVPVAMPFRRVDGMKLTSAEYDQLVQLSRVEPIPAFDGRTFKEQLEFVMDSSLYDLATPDYRVVLLKNVQKTADEVARATLEKENDEYADRIANYRARKRAKLFGDEVGQ